MTLQSLLHTTGAIFEFIFFIALLFFFFVIVSPLLPTKSYVSTFAVVSGSMEPHIPVGALAFVRQLPPQQLTVGDIITFTDPTNPTRTILHRIIKIEGSGGMTEFKTKGDNNPVPDEWTINGINIKGKMLSSIPYLGYPILFAQTPTGYAVLVGLPALVLSIINIKNIIEGVREELTKHRKTTISINPATTS